MFAKFLNFTLILCFALASLAVAQSGHLQVAMKSSTWGAQASSASQLTSIDRPLSWGVQLRYFPRSDWALQYSLETLTGKSNSPAGNELNIQSSFALLGYPAKFGRLSPYVIQGVNWMQRYNADAPQTRNKLSFQFGAGVDFAIIGNAVFSSNAKIYSNGWQFQGWGMSFSFGYLF